MTTQRPPIVTVLGHVDHGKTTLLDAVRKSHVASREAGGITQSIGASQITTKEGNAVTFIDTPGHAAFTKMRSQGAQVADIAVLVVAADDGVKPQTVEAIGHIREAAIPYVVAFTKTDLPSAAVDSAQGQLEKEGVLFEGRGGDVPFVEVSAKAGKGIEDLLSVLGLLAEVHDIKGDKDAKLEAVVIETSKDKRGLLASVVVRNGTLRVGDRLFTENASGKVRGLFNHLAQSVKTIGPGEPAQILGFDQLPQVGSRLTRSQEDVQAPMVEVQKTRDIRDDAVKVIIKASTLGSLEAILANIPPGVAMVASGVGEITQGDIFMAKSGGASIYSFELKTPGSIDRLAKTEGVTIQTFKIIYELFEALEELVSQGKDEVVGRAEIVAVFPFDGKKVAGCKVTEGKVTKGDKVKIVRGEKELGDATIASIRRGKVVIPEAKSGEECGILFHPQLDFTMGDVLLSVAT